jgi:hypothetical protein
MMKPARLPLLLLASALPLYAANLSDDDDLELLREFINTKRQETLSELSRRLSISGEVRSELQVTGETKDGVQQRGHKGAVPEAASDAYDVEVNINIDYRTDRTWASASIEFDENAGIFYGDSGKVNLERAYFGVRFFRGDISTSDIEIGRRPMGQIYDSRIEFGSRNDGILFKYDLALPSYGDFYIHAGPFLVNERIDQYAYAGELGFLNIGNTGIYIKYSLVDWDTKDYANAKTNGSFRFINSQWILNYKFVPQPFGRIVSIYGAFLINHAAERREISNNELANLGGYLGFTIGQLRKQGDWAVDVCYQIVEAQAVPDFDSSGIGLGNAAKTGFYMTKLDGCPTTVENAAGNTNFRGIAILWRYNLTDNLLLTQSWQQSVTLNDNIGPFRRFKQYEIEFIYAF